MYGYQYGYGVQGTDYGAYGRIPNSPTLECAKGATNTYSRFTSNLENTTKTNKDVNINNDLKHPIALLTADELVMSGVAWHANTSHYLYDAYKNGLSHDEVATLTPDYFDHWDGLEITNDALIFTIKEYNGISRNFSYVSFTYGVRPVINLRADVLYDSGDGTSGSGAYTVKLAN